MWVALARISRSRPAPRWLLAAALAGVLPGAAGCVTVRPEERAILADPKMRFQGDPKAAAAQAHAIENREGSFGGGSVEGGGCGCN
jgi:hypothetical protein